MEWISVKDRLPAKAYQDYKQGIVTHVCTESNRVLVCTTTGHKYVTKYDHEFNMWRSLSDMVDYDVTHWMPLPKTPEQ